MLIVIWRQFLKMVQLFREIRKSRLGCCCLLCYSLFLLQSFKKWFNSGYLPILIYLFCQNRIIWRLSSFRSLICKILAFSTLLEWIKRTLIRWGRFWKCLVFIFINKKMLQLFLFLGGLLLVMLWELRCAILCWV